MDRKDNKQSNTTVKPDLESEESAGQRNNQETSRTQQNITRPSNHPKQGLKILTPNQMLSRLPITLPQL